MFSVDLSTREFDGDIVVAMGGGDLPLAAPRQPALRVLSVTHVSRRQQTGEALASPPPTAVSQSR